MRDVFTHTHTYIGAYAAADTVSHTLRRNLLKQVSPVFSHFIHRFMASHKSTGSQKK